MAVRSYKTHGQAISMHDLYDKLIDFLVNAAGWTLDTDLGLRDKVYSIDGIGASKPPIYVQLTADKLAGDLTTMYGPSQMISARGYVDYAANRFPFGVFGPEVWTSSSVSGRVTGVLDVSGGPGNAQYHTSTSAFGFGTAVPGSAGGSVNSGRAARSRAIMATTASVYDLVTGVSTTKSSSGLTSSDGRVWLTDTLGHDKLFFFTTSSVAGSRFVVYDIFSDTYIHLADPPWTAATQAYSVLGFDGVDTIYALRGQSSAEFAKYSIAGNTWTSLASAPLNKGNYAHVPLMFVPKVLSGLTEDRVYVALNAGSTSGWYYYIVDGSSANTWVQMAAAPGVLAPTTWVAFYAGQSTIYAANSAVGAVYTYNINTNTWSTQASAISSNDFYRPQIKLMYRYAAELQGPTSGLIDWWMSGDRDSVRVVTREVSADGAEKYRTMYMGYYNSKFSTTQFPVSSGVAPGDGVVVNLAADPTIEVTVGSHWVLVDPDTGVTEGADVVAVSANTVTLQRVNNTYGVNSFLSQDPYPFVLSDGHFACPVFGAAGYRGDNRPDMLHVYAPSDSVIDRVVNTELRSSMPMKEATMFGGDQGYPASNDVFGSLKGIYYLSDTGGFPGPGVEISFSGGTILVIRPYELEVGGSDLRRVAVLLA